MTLQTRAKKTGSVTSACLLKSQQKLHQENQRLKASRDDTVRLGLRERVKMRKEPGATGSWEGLPLAVNAMCAFIPGRAKQTSSKQPTDYPAHPILAQRAKRTF